MSVRAFRFSCVLLLCGAVPSFAQQTGPRTLEGLLNSGEAQKPAAAPEAAMPDAGPKRPAGTVTRPKNGVQHPDLDKAWVAYEAAVAKVTESIRAAIAKQFDAAATKGDLDSAEKWQAALEKFEKTGEAPAQAEIKATLKVPFADYTKAKDELAKAYEAVVKALTMDKKIAEAKAVRDEGKRLSDETDSPPKDVTAGRKTPTAEVAKRPTLPAGNHFVGMIGRYQMGGKPIPFLILSVPSGANVFNESVRSLMNGKISIEPGIMSFEATALLPIPKDGLYRVTAGRACTVSIAGKKYDLSNYSAKNGAAVELIKGVHRFGLSVGNNGGQLAEASVEVRDAGNGALLSPVIGRGDLESLLDEKLTEVSGWRPIPLNPKLKD